LICMFTIKFSNNIAHLPLPTPHNPATSHTRQPLICAHLFLGVVVHIAAAPAAHATTVAPATPGVIIALGRALVLHLLLDLLQLCVQVGVCSGEVLVAVLFFANQMLVMNVSGNQAEYRTQTKTNNNATTHFLNIHAHRTTTLPTPHLPHQCRRPLRRHPRSTGPHLLWHYLVPGRHYRCCSCWSACRGRARGWRSRRGLFWGTVSEFINISNTTHRELRTMDYFETLTPLQKYTSNFFKNNNTKFRTYVPPPK